MAGIYVGQSGRMGSGACDSAGAVFPGRMENEGDYLTQNITLAAMEKGLGICVEDQAVAYQKGAREIKNSFPPSVSPT